MVPAWRRNSNRNRLSFSSSRLPRTSRLTSATVSATTGLGAEILGDAILAEVTPAAEISPLVGVITCGRRHKYTKPSAKIDAKPPTRIHFKLSRRAGTVVVAAVVASAPEASNREFTDALAELSPAGGAPFSLTP